jgi:hypothetical protein
MMKFEQPLFLSRLVPVVLIIEVAWALSLRWW